MAKQPKKRKQRSADGLPELHHLYEASVQSVDVDLDFAVKAYRQRNGRKPKSLREDFCGTAALAVTWVRRSPEHTAIGLDLDRPTLAWAKSHNVATLDEEARRRIDLRREDVRSVTDPKVDVEVGLNFSYWIFKTRAEVLSYFQAARASLAEGGVLVLDLFGGTEAMLAQRDERRVDKSVTLDGTKVPAFTYVWDQASFNPIDHDFQCVIGFELKGGGGYPKAFTYDWRFWTMPELRELLAEAGFVDSFAYTDDWDDDEDDSTGVYKKRKRFDNDGVWVGYLVAWA